MDVHAHSRQDAMMDDGRNDVRAESVFNARWGVVAPSLPTPQPGPARLLPGFAADPPDSPFDIIGEYRAFIVVRLASAEEVRGCLPTFLAPAPVPGVPADRHPVMFSCGTHHGVHPRFFHAWEYDYAESLVGIPNVMHVRDDGRRMGPYFFMTAVRLNNEFADLIGVALGFPKELSTFDLTDTAVRISTVPRGDVILTGEMQQAGDVFGPSFPNFAAIAPLMQQPVISTPPAGGLVITPFRIDVAHARMVPMRGRFVVHGNTMAGLPGGTYEFASIADSAFDGGYFSVHSWRMSPPQPTQP